MSQPAYRLFNVELKRREQLSPALTRFVFGGPEVAEMKTLAADQRIKIFFPDASGQPPSLPGGSEWYQAYRSVEPARRPPMRTYTIRALRAEQEEVDVEFVLHGENGPASAWATHARIGDRLQLAAPNRQYGDDPGGYEWKPPAGVRHILLIADETALPAVAEFSRSWPAKPSRRWSRPFSKCREKPISSTCRRFPVRACTGCRATRPASIRATASG
ncbi:siderophore-interacting protein [Pseudomonas aeruginosa]